MVIVGFPDVGNAERTSQCAAAGTHDDHQGNGISGGGSLEGGNMFGNGGTGTKRGMDPSATVIGSKCPQHEVPLKKQVRKEPRHTVERDKARFVAKGFRQVPAFEFDPNETYAASTHSTTMIMAEAATGDWDLDHVDVEQAFV